MVFIFLPGETCLRSLRLFLRILQKKEKAGRENFNQITGLCIRNFRHTVYFAAAGYFGTVAAGAGTGDDNSPANSA